ncbi:unnamed protein product [Sphagnum jensenii]|uniref:Protein kinase domain-containing protein n=1 Tax=Sphagnum jensenii TaxID=128206 RepID=A0ABP0VT78_9BRYO
MTGGLQENLKLEQLSSVATAITCLNPGSSSGSEVVDPVFLENLDHEKHSGFRREDKKVEEVVPTSRTIQELWYSSRTSDVDFLEDGYRWRKSYYKCRNVGYADVEFKCELHGEMAAPKLFNTSNTTEVKAVKNEAKLLASLRHPNVVQFVGYAVNKNEHYIITELMSKDLRMYLKENVPLSLPLAVDIMLQIVEGMKYLHDSGVMHHDLKAYNFLISVVENELYISPSVQVKLTDFGLSKLNLNNSRFTTMERGNAHWRAPEILGKIRCGERPILPPNDYCPLHLSAFIKECWATRPEDHPKFPEICQRLWECKDTILIPLPMPPPKTLNREKGHTYTMCN